MLPTRTTYIYLGCVNSLYYLLRTRQRRQAQLNRPQRRHVILHYQRHIIIQIHLDLITQVRTFDEIPEVFEREFPLNNLPSVLLMKKLHTSIRLYTPHFRRRKLSCAPEYQLIPNRFNLQLL